MSNCVLGMKAFIQIVRKVLVQDWSQWKYHSYITKCGLGFRLDRRSSKAHLHYYLHSESNPFPILCPFSLCSEMLTCSNNFHRLQHPLKSKSPKTPERERERWSRQDRFFPEQWLRTDYSLQPEAFPPFQVTFWIQFSPSPSHSPVENSPSAT
jgi:hypothetical protein